jgi:hypothetical protein
MKSGIPLSPEWSPVILSSLIFVLSSRWAVRKIHQDAEDRSKSGRSKYTSDNNFSQEEMAKISPRGQRCLGNNTSYLKYFLRSLSSMCHPTDNPTGHIALCMAENKLVLDVLGERLMQFGTTTAAFSNSAVFCYNSFLGIPICRQSAAYFLAKRFLFPDKPSITPEEALQHIDPSSVAVTSGAVSALNSLFFLLGQEGDACLIPAPYYAAFDSDMNVSDNLFDPPLNIILRRVYSYIFITILTNIYTSFWNISPCHSWWLELFHMLYTVPIPY